MKDVDREKKQIEVKENYEAFIKLLPSILESKAGKYAVMRHKEVLDFFDSFDDAVTYGNKMFEDGMYSIQKVENTIVNLGFYSYAKS